MTVYALRLNNGADTAARVRMGDLLGLSASSNLGARQGIRPGPTAANVAVVAGAMQVTVQPFLAFVDGGISDAQGGYPFVCDAAVTLTLADGHASLSRTDVVAAVVRDDPYDSSGALDARVMIVQGTPGGGAPTLPANTLPIRNVTVPAGKTASNGGLVSGNLSTDRRTYLSGTGGTASIGDATERGTLPAIPGTVIYRRDTTTLEVLDGANWRPIPLGAWLTYTPVVSATAGSINAASADMRYTVIGKTMLWTCDLTVTNAGTAGGAVQFTMPFNAARTFGSIGTGCEDAVNGKGLVVKLGSAAVAQVYNYDFTTAFASGAILRMHGTVELA